MNKNNLQRLTALAAITVLTPLVAEGGGFALIESSASGMGNAFAGSSAVAEDATTLAFNPAGMSRLQGRQLVAAAHYISPLAQFNNSGSSDGLGNALSGPNADGGVDAIVPNLYTTTKLDNRWHLGLAINAPFGMTTEYDDDWVGRYHALNSALTTINFTPSVAYRHSEQLALGFGLSVQYLDVSISSAIDFGTLCLTQELTSALPSGSCGTIGLQPQQSDGFAEISGNNWALGWNAGLLYMPSNSQRIGLSYRAAITQDVSGEADFTVPGEAASLLASSGTFVDTGADAKVTLPASASLSYFQQLSDRVAVMADATWTNWQVFDELRIRYDNPNQPDSVTTEKWQDTWRYAVGMNYTLNETVMLRLGAALDQATISNDIYRTPRIPDGERRWLALGMRYKVSNDTVINAGYAHLFVEDMTIDNTLESSIPTLQAKLSGSYDAEVNIFSLQLTRNF